MKQGGWPSLILIYLYGVVSAASLAKAIPLQAHISGLPGASPALFGLFISLVAILPALFGTVSGALIDRLGARPALILAALIGALVNGLYLLAGSFLPFQALRIVEGAIPLLVYAAAPALMIATSAPERRSGAMALWSSYTPVGTSLGLLISAAFAAGVQWRFAYLTHGAIFLLLAVLGLALPKTAARAAAHGPRRSVLALLKSPEGIAPLRLASAFGVLILLGLGVSVVMPPFLSRHYAITLSAASGIMAVTNVVMILGSTLSGVCLTRGVQPATLFMGLGSVGTIAGCALFAPWRQMGLTLTALIIWLICTGGRHGRAGLTAAEGRRPRTSRVHRRSAQSDRRAHDVRHLAPMAGSAGAQSMAGAVPHHPYRLGSQPHAAARPGPRPCITFRALPPPQCPPRARRYRVRAPSARHRRSQATGS
ncbi:MAG: MFS transporter [Steroidobacteraceae bacterium]